MSEERGHGRFDEVQRLINRYPELYHAFNERSQREYWEIEELFKRFGKFIQLLQKREEIEGAIKVTKEHDNDPAWNESRRIAADTIARDIETFADTDEAIRDAILTERYGEGYREFAEKYKSEREESERDGQR